MNPPHPPFLLPPCTPSPRGLDRLRDSAGLSSATRARIELLQQRWLQPSLVLLDVGMATELSPADQVGRRGWWRWGWGGGGGSSFNPKIRGEVVVCVWEV